nr:hypothetical protein UQVBLVYK_UQVBLVYK_CDS_0010 [Microvirus sp.]
MYFLKKFLLAILPSLFDLLTELLESHKEDNDNGS